MIALEGELPLSETQFLIMTGMADSAHGYAVMQHVERITKGRVTIGPGTMYGTIKKLEKKRLISRMPAESGDERRITYHLTDSGRRLLSMEIERLDELAGIGKRTTRGLRSDGNG